jgi:GLPGLI family protein
MKKTIILSILFLVLLLNCFSQNNPSEILYLCKYKYAFIKDTTNRKALTFDYMNLEICKESSRYYSKLRQIGYNKSLEDYKNQTPFETIMKNENQYYLNAESEIIIFNYREKSFDIYEKLSSKSEYKSLDTLGVPNWELQSDTMTLLGQLCQKATTNYRGRSYIAWFANTIPFQVGPWKFVGLPGLVLKISDTKNNFDFECIELTNKIKSKPVFTLYTKRKTIPYKKLQGLKKLKMTDRDLFMSSEYAGISSPSNNNAKRKKQPYNPIDLTN